MDVRNVRALRGPNVWADFPVIEATIDPGPLPYTATLDRRLKEWLPSLTERPDSAGSPRAGLPEPLLPGASLARTFPRLVLELQRLAGSEVAFANARETPGPGDLLVACEYEHEELGRAAFDAARDLYLAAERSEPFDPAASIARLRDLAARVRPAPLVAAVMQAARQRGVPVRPLAGGILLLGQGARQRRVLGARTDCTSALAESIARDAELTRKLLTEVGVPVGAPPEARYRALVVGGQVVTLLGVETEAGPDLAATAIEAAAVIGLDVAGVVLTEQGGVVAVEADPPVDGAAARQLGEAIVAHLFSEKADGRVPVVAVTGVNGKTTTTRLIAHMLAQAGQRVGMTCTEGISIAGQQIEQGDCSGPLSARTVLQHPDVDAAVLETARGGVLRAGLGYDRCDLAVVTNIGEGDHLGSAGIETAEQLARVKRVPVEAVRPGGTAVLNAADPLVVAMAGHCGGSVTYFSRNPDHPLILDHRAAGGRAAFVRDGRVVLAEGPEETPVASLAAVPLTGGGRIGFQVENVLAATAAAHALGLERRTIRAALRSFGSGVDHAPARFNLLEVNGAVAVLDYGHNVSSLVAILDALALFPSTPRAAVYSAAGDRRDADLVRQGELLGDAFDRVILYEDGNCTRGRQAGEIMSLFRRGLTGRARVADVQEVVGAVKAVDLALSSAQPGEVLLIQVDIVAETMELVRGYLAGAAAREIDLEEALALTGDRSSWGAMRRQSKGAGLPRGVRQIAGHGG